MTANSPDEPEENETLQREFVEDKPPSPGLGAPPPPRFKVTPEWWRELTRAGLAMSLMALLGAAVLIILLGKTAEEAKELFGQVLAPLIGLVGAATGFYYGGEKK